MPSPAVRILHLQPAEDAGELTQLLARARAVAAEELAARFRVAGADDVDADASLAAAVRTNEGGACKNSALLTQMP